MCRVILSFLALFLPPLAVLFHNGCTINLLINLLLTLLGLIPGVIHAWYLLWCYEPVVSHQHTTVYVQGHPAPPAYSG